MKFWELIGTEADGAPATWPIESRIVTGPASRSKTPLE